MIVHKRLHMDIFMVDFNHAPKCMSAPMLLEHFWIKSIQTIFFLPISPHSCIFVYKLQLCTNVNSIWRLSKVLFLPRFLVRKYHSHCILCCVTPLVLTSPGFSKRCWVFLGWNVKGWGYRKGSVFKIITAECTNKSPILSHTLKCED